MRGTGPTIPERAGAHSLTSDRYGPALLRRCAYVRGAARVTKGHTMNQNMRRGPQRPQAARRPERGAANARQQYDRYLARAREAQVAGDVIETENWYQHAEHYFRIMRGAGDERRS